MTILLLACAPDRAYVRAREACGLADGEFVALPAGEAGSYRTISMECADRLGRDVGMDWSSFAEEPHVIDVPTTVGERVIAGLFTLVASDVGTVGQLLGEPWLPELLRDGLGDVRGGLSDDDPAGALWWALVTDRVESLRLRNDVLPYEVYASYDAYGIVTVGPALGEAALGSMEVGSTLVHEASHSTAPHHIDCPVAGLCDQSPEGAYGIGATWADRWIQVNGAGVAETDARTAEEWIQFNCYQILDRSGFAPCGG